MDALMQFVTINSPVETGAITLNFHHVKKSALILRAINHKLRQQLIRLIDENERMTVTEMFSQLRLEQSVVSQHLAILRRAKIVTTEKESKFVFYSLNYKRLKEITGFVEGLVV